MATYTPYWFGNGLLNLHKGNINLLSDTFKLSLHTGTFTPNQDTHDYRDDLTNELGSGNGYTTGGATLSVANPPPSAVGGGIDETAESDNMIL